VPGTGTTPATAGEALGYAQTLLEDAQMNIQALFKRVSKDAAITGGVPSGIGA
jgi:hypothetical protein